MKLVLALIMLLSFAACDSKKEATEADNSSTSQEMNSQDESHEGHDHSEAADSEEEDESMGGIAEENDMCICTKDFRPVCGKDGNTYPNPCQAGCAKVEVASEGACE